MAAARLEGSLCAVTGAGSGIGRATVERLAISGAHVIAVDIAADAVEATAQAAGEAVVSSYVCDVREADEVEAMFRDIAARFGGETLYGLANIAGIGSTETAPDTSLEVWENVFAVNVRGTFLTCRQAIPLMRARGGGAIVNMASVAGLVGLPQRAAYCASKGAVIAFTRALAVDHASEGIRVNCICPGTVATPWVRRLVEERGESLAALEARQPVGRLGSADEIAALAVYLLTDDAAFMTGSAVTIDGGLTAG